MLQTRILVLGSAAGGGFPQWNCNCDNCRGVRLGSCASVARTQSSIAVSENGKDWLLVNASPDILVQLRAAPALQPGRALRDSGIAAVLLMDAQLDHVAGLLMLREATAPLRLYATAAVLADLSGPLPLLPVLSHYCGVAAMPIVAGAAPFGIAPLAGTQFQAISLASKAPPYSRHRDDPHPGDNIGLTIRGAHGGASLFYAPGLGAVTPALEAAMAAADILLVDGTFWTEYELPDLGLSTKPAAAMGHLPLSGPAGMLALLARLPARRKILIHINNTNPILRALSAQRALLDELGIEVATDNLEIFL